MKRRIGTAVVGLSVLGFGIFGFTHGNGGGVVQAASEGDGGGAPAYAHGNHGEHQLIPMVRAGLRVMHMDIQVEHHPILMGIQEHQFMDMETIQYLLLM